VLRNNYQEIRINQKLTFGEIMKVLSLFDGKSSGFTAMELAGIPVTEYYSSEIDKHAIKVSDSIHPNQIRLGDVTKCRQWTLIQIFLFN
jgi:site-specific DNA-cytosine methylase